MPRGMRRGAYETDGGTTYRWNTDADRFLIATFGWTEAGGTVPHLPRGAHPRMVHGVSSTSGRRASAVVPSVTADVWTGAATSFTIEASDSTTDTMTIVGRSGERPPLP